MILSEKYDKTILNNELYDTVRLADIIEINNEKYLIVSAYLFNKKNCESNEYLSREYYSDTFFKRTSDEKTDIDAYYLIYNLEKKILIDNKKEFVEKNNVFKNIRLDKTKCNQIEIENQIYYEINLRDNKYLFSENESSIRPYKLIEIQNNDVQNIKEIVFNEKKNKAIIEKIYERISTNEKIEDLEKISKTTFSSDVKKYISKIIKYNSRETEEKI